MDISKLIELGIPSMDGYKVKQLGPTTKTKPLVLSEDESMTDYGNGQRFIHQHGEKVLFCNQENSWYIWNGKTWQSDKNKQIEVYAQLTAKSIFAEVEKQKDPKYKSDLQKWGRKSLDNAKLKKMLLSANVHLPVSSEQFDTHGWLLNVGNGTVDLKAGKRLPHRREDLNSKITKVEYHEDAVSPVWLDFLDRIFAGNVDLIRFVQKMVGYCLTGDVSEKCFFVLLGENGDNGKTVFINVLMSLLSEYGTNMPIDTLLQKKPGSQSNDIVRLKGARFISCSEANRQYNFDEALVKRLTGSDPITARALYKDYITFTPVGKIVIATNRMPRFDKTDRAFDSRLKMIPFDVTIPKEEQDRTLFDKLMEQADGILAWAVKGCLMWQNEGLGPVPTEAIPEGGVQLVCSVEGFLATCCDHGANLTVSHADLYRTYLLYHQTIGDGTQPLASSAMGTELSRLGIPVGHDRDGNYRVGIDLKPAVKEAQR
ncbi:hypothetical protein GMSM_29710 [Geomonas sp. Red276]